MNVKKLCVYVLAAQCLLLPDAARSQNESANQGTLRERIRQRLGVTTTTTTTTTTATTTATTKTEADTDRNTESDPKVADDFLDARTKYSIAGLDVAVWKPRLSTKAPLVIFSHGFRGSKTQSAFLMKALAQAGYLVLAPDHHDAGMFGHLDPRPQQSFAKPNQWTDQTYIDRHDDIVKLLAALRADPSWDKQIDWSKMALCGHSLGGYTVLGLAGARPGWKLNGVKAVIALSPYVTPYNLSGSLKNLNVPVMYQGGTRDPGCTPFVEGSDGAYSKSSSPAYFVDFNGFNHFSWTGFNQDRQKQEPINYYCIAFLDKYLKGSNDDRLSKKLPSVVELSAK